MDFPPLMISGHLSLPPVQLGLWDAKALSRLWATPPARASLTSWAGTRLPFMLRLTGCASLFSWFKGVYKCPRLLCCLAKISKWAHAWGKFTTVFLPLCFRVLVQWNCSLSSVSNIYHFCFEIPKSAPFCDPKSVTKCDVLIHILISLSPFCVCLNGDFSRTSLYTRCKKVNQYNKRLHTTQLILWTIV